MEARRDAAPVAASVTVEYDCERHQKHLRGTRNGLPDFVPYQCGAPRPAWAQRAVAATLAEFGEPRMRRVQSDRWTWQD